MLDVWYKVYLSNTNDVCQTKLNLLIDLQLVKRSYRGMVKSDVSKETKDICFFEISILIVTHHIQATVEPHSPVAPSPASNSAASVAC
jgi:hypothetical protein